MAPHLVCVSTCYVAGNRRGAAPEEPVEATPFSAGLDWRAEVTAARRSRADVDAQSRFLVRHVSLPWLAVPFESWCEGGCGASLVCVQPAHTRWAPRCEASPW